MLLLNKVLKLQKKRKYEISVGRSHFLTVTYLYFIVRNVTGDSQKKIQGDSIKIEGFFLQKKQKNFENFFSSNEIKLILVKAYTEGSYCVNFRRHQFNRSGGKTV